MKKEKGPLRQELDRIFGLSEEYSMMPLSSGQIIAGTSIMMLGVMIVGIPLGLLIADKTGKLEKDDINKTAIETEMTEQSTIEELLNNNEIKTEKKKMKYSYTFTPNSIDEPEYHYNFNSNKDIYIKTLKK